MKNGRKIAKEYLGYGLNPVPVGEDKIPLREGHNEPITLEEIDNFRFDGIGISTGIASGGLEAIDFDLKNSNQPEVVMQLFKSKIPKELLKKLVVQETVSGGYHMIYRCEDVSSSKKLAKSHEGKAVIETRGEGGYIKCYPSEGYTLLQGSFDNIPIISPEDRLKLFVSAKLLNRTVIKDANKRSSKEDKIYFRKFPKYNGTPDKGIEVLVDNGWTVHSEDSEWINLTRPDKDISDGISAGYHKDGKFLYVFTTSQDHFEEERPYNNHAIFAELECGGRYDVAYAKLFEMGYGVEDEKLKASSKELLEELEWEESLDKLTFLSDDIEENDYLEQARKDEIEQGLSTGWRELDEYFRFKRNSLNIGLGYGGVGKSIYMLHMAVASNLLHGWRWGMIMPENRTAMSRRRLIEASSGKMIKQFNTSSALFEDYKIQSRDNFKIISNRKHYSIKDVIDMGKKLYEEFGIDALLIDPYNFFKVTGNGYSFNNEILSELRVFAEKYCSVYIMAHPSSESPRKNIDEYGYLKPPSKYSIQGGADFPYRVDDFFVVHRVVNHTDKEVRKTMQFIMSKVKEVETGGRVHSNDEWSELVWEYRNDFLGYWDINGDNPMYKALMSKMGVRAKMKQQSTTVEEAF